MADPCELKFWKAQVLKADGDDLTALELPNPTNSKGAWGKLSQVQVQFPHWNVAMTSGRLSPCTKSCHSSWPGAFKALLVLPSPFSHTTQCPAVPSCQSVPSVEHQQELMPVPGVLFSPCWPTAARKAQPLFILWNEMGSFWQNINKSLHKTATKVFLMELPQNLNTWGSIINGSHVIDGERGLWSGNNAPNCSNIGKKCGFC